MQKNILFCVNLLNQEKAGLTAFHSSQRYAPFELVIMVERKSRRTSFSTSNDVFSVYLFATLPMVC